MAEVKIIDIDGVQWEIKDQTARNTLATQETKINDLQNNLNATNSKMYVNQSKKININNDIRKWIKIENIYPEIGYDPNIFLIGARRNAIYILSCSLDDNKAYWTPTIIKLYDELNKITSVKAKLGAIYIQSGSWNTISIQQLNNIPKQIIITEENPPEDAEDVTIIEK